MSFAYIPDPARALAIERTLFQQGAGSLFWSTTRCLVVPRSVSRRAGFEDVRKQSAWPVVERASGGGIVPQGPGILNISLVVPLSPNERSATPDFRWLCAPLLSLLKENNIEAYTSSIPGAFCDGRFNIVVGGQKLAGTAQRRGRDAALLHMVVIGDADIDEAIGAVNALEKRIGKPGANRTNAHTSLRKLLGTPEDTVRARDALIERYQRHLHTRRVRQGA